jgi:hypothetical protein
MLVVLAVLDLLAASPIVLLYFGLAVKFLIIAAGIYLLVKGLIFIKDIASAFDVGIALFLFLSLITPLPKIILIIAALFLIQKAAFSFLS